MTQQQLKIKQSELTLAHHDYQKQLRRYSLSKVSNPALAEDLVQDTFLRAWNYLLKGGKVDTMKSFLYQILHRLIIDEYRKGKRTSSLDDLVEKGFEPSVQNNSGEEFSHISTVIDGKATMLLIRQLPERYRKVVSMKYVDNMSLEEISEVVGKSKNTIAVQLHRGLIKLKEIFDTYNDKCEGNYASYGTKSRMGEVAFG